MRTRSVPVRTLCLSLVFSPPTLVPARPGPHGLTPTFASGTAAQLTDTTRDYLVYFQIGTGGGTVSIAIGPASSVANAIIASAAGVAGAGYSVRLPAGWFLKITVATSTIASQIAIGC